MVEAANKVVKVVAGKAAALVVRADASKASGGKGEVREANNAETEAVRTREVRSRNKTDPETRRKRWM